MNERFFDAITEFIFLRHDPEPADMIFIPGSDCEETVHRAAWLYRNGYAPFVLPSGRYSKLSGSFKLTGFQSEWEYMKSILLQEGVPDDAILKEDQATFTWENAIFSARVVRESGITVRKAIICCQAFHARRAYTYYQQQFPGTVLLMAPSVTKGIDRDNWYLDKEKAAVVLGELQRCGDQFRCMIPPGDPIGWGPA